MTVQARQRLRDRNRFLDTAHRTDASCPRCRVRDLHLELDKAEVALSWKQQCWLTQVQGITNASRLAAGGWGVARVWPGHDGDDPTYLPGALDDGRDFEAIILGVWSGLHSVYDTFYRTRPALLDLLAFDARDPARWYMRNGGQRWCGKGGVNWLGEWEVNRALGVGVSGDDWPGGTEDTKPGPLRLFSTPLNWLKGGCRGAVLIAPDLENKEMVLREVLRGVPEIICDDRDHATIVDAAMKRTTPPPARAEVMIAEDEDWHALPEVA